MVATFQEKILEFDSDGVLVVGKCEQVRGRVVQICIAKVGLVSSGVQVMAGCPQQHQLDCGVWPLSKAPEGGQSGTVGMRDVDCLEFCLKATVLDGFGRQEEEMSLAQHFALLCVGKCGGYRYP